MRRLLSVLFAAAALLAVSPAAALARTDIARNVLPPGEFGGVPTTNHSTDQIPPYDALTPLRGNVTQSDIFRLYKPEDFKPIGASTVENTGRPGLKILRDSFGVPHIYGQTRADTWFGAGFVAAEDRGLLLRLGRNPARAAVADIPGVNAFALVTGGGVYLPSKQAEDLVTSEQQKLVAAYGAKGQQMLADFDAYAEGVTAGFRHTGAPLAQPWDRNDVIAVAAFIGSIFGNGGGTEAQNADLLARLQARLGSAQGTGAFQDLLEPNDPETQTTTARRFPYGSASGGATAGSPAIDAGSEQAAPNMPLSGAPSPPAPRLMSNFLVVGPNRSANRDPLAVMGPQLGYFYPEIVFEGDLHGPGINAQGSLVPGGGPYILIGRTKDYAWSLTSASNDNRDEFLEQLCNPDGSAPTRSSDHYLYKGKCRAMETFDAGTLNGAPQRFHMTVHGPVQSTATMGGRPYAVARQRSTFGRESVSIAALRDMTLGAGRTVNGFYRAANEFGFTFNWAYASHRHVAFFSAGQLPRRAPGLNRMLPTLGTGAYDWRGFISLGEHPHESDPPGGVFLNWNNKPAADWISGDDQHSYGSVHRVELFDHFPAKVRLRDVVSIMNRAATEDLRGTQVWPDVAAVLRTGRAPDARTAQAVQLVSDWSGRGASRLDGDLDGKIDDPGAAIMDRAFSRIADAVIVPRLGSVADALAKVNPRDRPANPGGSSFGAGWYGYVDKDLRTLLGRRVRGRFHMRYCGRGSLTACRESLYAAVRAAADELAAQQGSDPRAWRSDATKERIRFSPGLIQNTMRWTNRSTFQQVLEFVNPVAAARTPRRHRAAPRFTG